MLGCIILVVLLNPVVTAEKSTREIVINIPEFTLYLYQNGIQIRQYEIGIGNEVKPSVLGDTEVINRVVNPTYYPPRWWERGLEPIPPGPENPVGTRWIGLGFPSYGIHGTNNPDSIGRAMSSGCIRMYNHDVEELMDLISIGTPVTIIYETIKLIQDPLIDTKMITVYPDIYRQGTNTISNVERLVANLKWDNVYFPVVDSILQSASGEPQPIPIAVDYRINDQLQDAKSVKYGKQYYVPVTAGGQYDDRFLWDQEYVNLVEFAATHGLNYQINDAVEVFGVELTFDGDLLDVDILVINNELYLSLTDLTNVLKLPLDADLRSRVDLVNGEEYLHYEAVANLGLEIDWVYPKREAKLQGPQAYLDGQWLGIVLFSDNEEIYLPFNPIVDLINAHVEFLDNQDVLLFYNTHGVNVIKDDEIVYVPEWVVRWLMPGAKLIIKYP